jgi:branched-chain amino acid transport system ATP-binding protein
MNGAVLKADRLHTYYGKESYSARRQPRGTRGRDHYIAGRNGAGKTTTLRSLVGLTPARERRVCVFGNTRVRALAGASADA